MITSHFRIAALVSILFSSACHISAAEELPQGRDASPLWQNTGPRVGEFIYRPAGLATATADNSVEGRLRAFRGTLSASAAAPERSFTLGAFNKKPLQFSVGSQQLPAFELAGVGAQSGASFGTKRISIGTSYPQHALARALLNSDPGAPDAMAPADESRATWITARPLESKFATLDFLAARAIRDLNPGQQLGKQFVKATLFGFRGDANLPANWKLRGEWLKSRLESQPAAGAWKLALNGPVHHPWGRATMTFDAQNLERGFATLANPTPAEGGSSTRLAVQQSIAAGKLTGSLSATLAQQARNELADVPAGTPVATNTLQTATSLRYGISKSLALVGTHTLNKSSQRLLADGDDSISSALDNTADVALEIKLNNSLALTVGSGETITSTTQRLSTNPHVPLSRLIEQRVNVGLRRQTALGSVGLQVTRHKLSDELKGITATSADSLTLEAQRQVLPALLLTGSYLWSGNKDVIQQLRAARASRSAAAQLRLPTLGSLGLRYSDWDGSQVCAASGVSLTGAREYGISFNMGGPPAGSRLGMSLEYALQDLRDIPDTSTWRVGFTYK